MSPADSDAYTRITGRITRLSALLVVFGTIQFSLLKGWRFGLSFLLGATISTVSFWGWRRTVEALDGGRSKRRAWPVVLRFMGLAGLSYAIIKYLEVTAIAVLVGLFVSATATLVNLILELIYARK